MSTLPLLDGYEYTPPRPERRHGKHYGDTYAAPREATRIRLTAAESRPIRYVLSEWAGEVGLASTMPTQIAGKIEQLASKDENGQDTRVMLARLRRPTEGTPQTISCSASHATSYHGWEMLPADRWCDERRSYTDRWKDRREQLKSWRALRAMADVHSHSLVVLHALYGDRQPGLPAPGLWDRSVDWDYCRVVRFAGFQGEHWSGAALDAATLVRRNKVATETDAQCKARVAAQTVWRADLLLRLGAECEEMIGDAVVAYRAAWRNA